MIEPAPTDVVLHAQPGERNSGAHWYAIWTRAQHEKQVHEYLRQRSIEVFLPTVSRWSRWKDRKKHIEWPLFPGYCFAHFGPADHPRVLRCKSVVAVLGNQQGPTQIPESEIEAIRRLIHARLAYDPCPHIKEGTLVEVVHGPLQGVVGRLVRKGSHARLVLSVTLINQGVSVEVDAADVRPH